MIARERRSAENKDINREEKAQMYSLPMEMKNANEPNQIDEREI